MPTLVALDIADAPELWRELGFTVEGATTWVSGVCHRLGRPGQGVVSWTLRHLPGFTELPTDPDEGGVEPDAPDHPNGVIALDHVVITTPDLARTIEAFESGGLTLRRTRQAGTGAHTMTQAFFTLGPVVIEVVGPPAPAAGDARFWGLTFTVTDLDATAERLGLRLRPIKGAAQPGRRIATLDRAVGSSVPMAFMSAKP